MTEKDLEIKQLDKKELSMNDEEKTCESCKWWEEFCGVCCNGESEHRADFTDTYNTCDKWEANT